MKRISFLDLKKVRLLNPYISGFLAFREVDSQLELFNNLKTRYPGLIPQVRSASEALLVHHKARDANVSAAVVL